jgi:D-serine deaminase-like pyridoxal phosphate-dependent protein
VSANGAALAARDKGDTKRINVIPMGRFPWPELPEDLSALTSGDAAPKKGSPALIFRLPAIERNLEAALGLAKAPARLRPHVKTHKCAEIVRLQVARGIRKFKVATLAEADLAASAGAKDVLIAYPQVGAAVMSLGPLQAMHPGTRFGVIVDSKAGVLALRASGIRIDVWLDLDTGMGRTGIRPGPEAFDLVTFIDDSPDLHLEGLHAYDGHRAEPDPGERRRAAERELEPVLRLRDRISRPELPLVCGGTPSFPCYAGMDSPGIECSPGIFLLHDARYATRFPDLPFEPAAVICATLISRPSGGRFTIDCGTKSLCPDCPPAERAVLLGHPGVQPGPMSEEHWVWTGEGRGTLTVGQSVILVPGHICPTAALHRAAFVIDGNGRVIARWPIDARRHLGPIASTFDSL